MEFQKQKLPVGPRFSPDPYEMRQFCRRPHNISYTN